MRKYDVALSFAGEDRRHAEALANLLRSGGSSYFPGNLKHAYPPILDLPPQTRHTLLRPQQNVSHAQTGYHGPIHD